MIIAETPRLILRHFIWNDLDKLAKIYGDPIVMKFLYRTWTYEETKQQLDLIFDCYEKYGFGEWAIVYKANNKLIGRCGLMPHKVDGEQEIAIGYTLSQEYWGQGLATEATRVSRNYGFEKAGVNRLISLIASENIASQKVAMKNRLKYEKDTIKYEKTIYVYAVHKHEIS